MKVKAKIINYYCGKDNTDCFGDCNKEKCRFCEREYIFIDKDYKKCTFYEDIWGIYYLEIGNKTYEYDSAMHNQGYFVDTVFEYIFIDNELIFGEYKEEINNG